MGCNFQDDWIVKKTSYSTTISDMQKQDKSVSVIIDNTKYPCNGAYYPNLALMRETSVDIKFDYTYFFLEKVRKNYIFLYISS